MSGVEGWARVYLWMLSLCYRCAVSCLWACYPCCLGPAVAVVRSWPTRSFMIYARTPQGIAHVHDGDAHRPTRRVDEPVLLARIWHDYISACGDRAAALTSWSSLVGCSSFKFPRIPKKFTLH